MGECRSAFADGGEPILLLVERFVKLLLTVLVSTCVMQLFIERDGVIPIIGFTVFSEVAELEAVLITIDPVD